jgi:hypothetical protein
MTKILYVLGGIAVGVAVYDKLAFFVDKQTGRQTLPFLYKGPLAAHVSENTVLGIGVVMIVGAYFLE